MDRDFSSAEFRDSKGRVVERPPEAPIEWRPSVYAAITSPDHPGCLLMVNTNDAGGVWQLPGGGLETTEPFLQGLQREIQEETGYDSVKIHSNDAVVSELAFYHSTQQSFCHSLILIFSGELPSGASERPRIGDPTNPGEIQQQRWMPLVDLALSDVHVVHRDYVEKLKK